MISGSYIRRHGRMHTSKQTKFDIVWCLLICLVDVRLEPATPSPVPSTPLHVNVELKGQIRLYFEEEHCCDLVKMAFVCLKNRFTGSNHI